MNEFIAEWLEKQNNSFQAFKITDTQVFGDNWRVDLYCKTGEDGLVPQIGICKSYLLHVSDGVVVNKSI
jgi:hypothetical protein